ncbi:DUF1223 domain-containing protein [Sphingobacterium sp. MYb382]|uniref:DUF1223 domain-containing protein n=1 Tax=Sphingobacterium sp. MYb382 TaxID=2745278 RepID=UPI00309644B8
MNYSKKLLIYLSLPLLIGGIMAFKEINNTMLIKHIKKEQANNSFAVIELFTSEGCWSCPPADALLAKLAENNKNEHVYIMAFHVDYWDHQGWKDRFSKAAFTDRQKQYATWMRLSTIYTPQLVINGKLETVGSDESKVLQGIQTTLQQPQTRSLSLKLAQEKGKEVQIQYETASTVKNTQLLMALVQGQASSQVAAGENAGKRLTHVQLVRDLQKRSLKTTDTFTFKLPNDNANWQIIAFEQDSHTGAILDAAQLNL